MINLLSKKQRKEFLESCNEENNEVNNMWNKLQANKQWIKAFI